MIHSYGYKPSPIFGFKNDRERAYTRLTFGIEVEVSPSASRRIGAERLSDRFDEIGEGRVYCKSDCSINNEHGDGVEIVSHPGTLAHHMYVMHWRGILNQALKKGYRSHDALGQKCGLHIHVGREQLGVDADSRGSVIRRVQMIFGLFRPELIRFSRRSPAQLDHWAPIDDLTHLRGSDGEALRAYSLSRYTTSGGGHNSRYTAVNITNSATVEIRIFRGTCKRDTLIASIQLVNSIFRWAMTHTWADLAGASFTDIALCEPYSELVAYLLKRGLIDEATATATPVAAHGNRDPEFTGTDGVEA